jgi:hypothetical protein
MKDGVRDSPLLLLGHLYVRITEQSAAETANLRVPVVVYLLVAVDIANVHGPAGLAAVEVAELVTYGAVTAADVLSAAAQSRREGLTRVAQWRQGGATGGLCRGRLLLVTIHFHGVQAGWC